MSNVLVNFVFGGDATKLAAAAQQASSSLTSTNTSLIEQRVRFLAATAAITGFVGALTSAIKASIETSAEFQRLSTSFVSILADNLIEAKGGAALTQENLETLRSQSVRLFREAQKGAVDTAFTTQEYVKILQSALAVGQNIGLTQEHILDLTRNLARAASSFGIDGEKTATAVAQIFTGTVRATNQLGRNLGLGTEEARKLLKEAIANGTAFEFLNSRIKGFAANAKEFGNNFVAVASSVKDVFQIGSTAAVKPLFDLITQQLIEFRNKFLGSNQDSIIQPALQRIIDGFQQFFKNVIPSLIPLFNSIGNLLSSIGSQSNQIALAFKGIILSLATIIDLIAEAISLRGTGGLLASVYLLAKAWTFVNSIVQQYNNYLKLQAVAQGAQAITNVAGRGLTFATQDAIAAQQTLTSAQVIAAAAGTGNAGAQQLLAVAETRATNAAAAESLAMEELAAAEAASAEAATAAAAAQAALYTRLGPLVVVAVAAIAIIGLLASGSDDAADSFKNLADQTQRFVEEQKKFAEDTSLQNLVEDYKRLSAQETLSYDDTKRLVEVTQLLKQALGDATIATKALSAEQFRQGQAKLNENLKVQNDELAKLKEAIDLKRKFLEGPSLLEFFTDTKSEEADKFFLHQKELEAVIDQLTSKYFPQFTKSQKESTTALGDLSDAIERQTFANKKRLESQDLLTKSEQELLDLSYQAKQADKDTEESKNKIQAATAALVLTFLREAESHGLVGKAARDAALDAINSAIKQQEAELKKQEAIELTNEALARQGQLYTVSIGFSEAERGGVGVLDKAGFEKTRDKIKSYIADLQQAAALLITKSAPSAKKGGGTRDRDELKDFLAEIQRQFTLVKKVADDLDKEATRIVEANRKLIRELGDTGVITFQNSIDIERALIDEHLKLQIDLANSQIELLQNAEDLGGAIADRTAKRAAKPKEKGHKGFDSRERKEELLKLAQDEVSIIAKLGDETRKAEEARSELVDREVKHRIDLRKQELENLDAVAKAQEETAATTQEGLFKLGLLSNEALVKGGIARTDAELERQRKAIVRQLFPLSDPKLKQELLNALTDIVSIGESGISDKAHQVFFELSQAGDDPDKLEQVRKNIQESINNEGLLAGLWAQRTSLLKQIADAKGSVDEATKVFEAFDTALAKGSKPPAGTQKEASDKLEALKKNLAEITAQVNPNIDKINRLIDTLSRLSVSDNEQSKLKAQLDELAEKRKQAIIKGQVELNDLTKTELEFRQRLVDFDLQRLDLNQQILDKQKELGVVTDIQARSAGADLINKRIALLNQRGGTLLQELKNTPAVSGNFDAEKKRLELENSIRDVINQIFLLKNQAIDLTSPLIATRDAFREIGDAVGNLPDPFNKLKGVFTGLATIADAIQNINRPDPGQIQFQAAQTQQQAAQTMLNAANTFANAAGTTQGQSSDSESSGLASGLIRGAGGAISGILGGIANHDIGQGIAGFSGLASLIPGVGPFLAGGLQILGGIFSFFGAAARKKTQEMAQAITAGIEDLKHAISTGAIGLGEGIRELQQKLVDARNQLSGRKGGKEELAKIQQNIDDEIKQLREQAKKVQDDFRAQLDLLRQPAGLRDTINAVRDIQQKAREFINSFENKADALAAIKEAQEFVHRSLQELKDNIVKTLGGLQQDLKDATEKFALDEKAILLEGRIDPAVSEAESKRQRLVQLERDFQKQRLDLEQQISAEQQKLDFVNQRFKFEEKIAQLAERGADALGAAADKLSNAASALQNAFNTIGRFNFGGSTDNTSGGLSTLNIRINGADAGQIQIGVPIEQHLDAAGFLSPSRQARFNPLI